MPEIFIAYRREDSAGYAGRLCESLERRLGAGQVFRDVDTLVPGQDFVRAIEARVRECQVFLALIGREWLDARDAAGHRRLDDPRDYARREVEAALARPEVLLIPVLVEGATMPDEAALPGTIKPLARRQAISLRDEAWDEDVERLIAAMAGALGRTVSRPAGPPPVASREPLRRRAALLITIAVLFAAVFLFFWRTTRHGADQASRSAGRVSGTPANDSARSDEPRGNAYSIAIPTAAEIVHGSLVYTILSGTVTPADSDNLLRLRVRLSNDGEYAANFWDGSFSLVVDGDVLAPSGGLNDTVDGHATRTAAVEFRVPPVRRATLRIANGDASGELSLDLTPSDEPAREDGGLLSRAVVRRVTDEARLLASDGDADYTLTRVMTRRFANALRVTVSVRVDNRGRYPHLFGSAALRLAVDGQPQAPLFAPNETIDGGSSKSGDFVFDLAPATTHVLLRTRVGDVVKETPIDLGG